MKSVSFSLICLLFLGAFGGSSCAAQTREDYYHANFSGEQLQQIFQAWQRLQADYEPDSSLSDFLVSVAKTGDVTTVAFARLPTVTHNPDGSDVIHDDSRYYRVVIHGEEVRVIPDARAH